MRKIIILLMLLPLFSFGQYKQQIGAGKTTDTTVIVSQLQVKVLATSDTNKVMGFNSSGQAVWRTKGGGLEGDSISTVLARGKNTRTPIRFGSGANSISTTIDSSGVNVRSGFSNYTNYTNNGSACVSSSYRYDYGYTGMYAFDLGTGYYTRLYAPSTSSSNKNVTIQDKSGTLALTSDITDTIANRVATKSDTLWASGSLRIATEADVNSRMATVTDTIANRVAVKSDTVWGAGSLRLVTESDINTIGSTRVNLNGNTVGSSMVYGVIDSQNLVTRVFNAYDTAYPAGRRVVSGKYGETIMSLYNYATATGIRQTKSINFAITNGVTAGANTPGIFWSFPISASTPRITEEGIFSRTVYTIQNGTSSTTILRGAMQSTNAGEVFTIGSGAHTVASNVPTAGMLTYLAIGTASASSGRYEPTSGNNRLLALRPSIFVNATGSYNGEINCMSDDSMSIVSVASGSYIAYKATKSIGKAFVSTGTAVNNFVGRTTFGTTTDNGADAVQVVGDLNLTTAGNKIKIATGSNASVNSGTFSGGTATVSNTAVTASSKIWIQYTSCSSCGTTYISARVAGTSFTVTSSNGSDASTFDYWIIN